jgi:hypothetical protein
MARQHARCGLHSGVNAQDSCLSAVNLYSIANVCARKMYAALRTLLA